MATAGNRPTLETMSRTTLSVAEETRDALYYQKQPDESYDAYLRRVCGLEADE